MNPIQKAISDLHQRIPKAILERAFIKNTVFGGIHTPVSIDYRIREEVINARVIPDCNLVGGTEVTISLQHIEPVFIDNYNMVYKIPKELTQNRTISRVVNVSFGQHGSIGAMNSAFMEGSAMLDAADGLMSSHTPIKLTSSAYVSLIAENTILVRDTMRMPGQVYARVVLEADENFSHLKPSSIMDFSKLVEFATKAYIYNNLIIEIDQAELNGGAPLGRFREIIDGYSDAEQLYQEHFNETWRKVTLFNDPEQFKRHLKLISGGRW